MKPIIFLDDGGVMSDPSVRGPQWQRLVGEFFAPILGGEPRAWAEVNRVFVEAVFEPTAWQARIDAASDYVNFERTYFLDWLGGMCRLVGVPQLSEEESLALTRRASVWITSRIHAGFPGAADAIRLLHNRGYTLYTASGESSTDLEGYLGTMGVRQYFRRLYGPDLLNTMKANSLFYERIFADAGVLPADALVVDDSLSVAGWVAEAGARVVLVGDTLTTMKTVEARSIRSLAELPGIIEDYL